MTAKIIKFPKVKREPLGDTGYTLDDDELIDVTKVVMSDHAVIAALQDAFEKLEYDPSLFVHADDRDGSMTRFLDEYFGMEESEEKRLTRLKVEALMNRFA